MHILTVPEALILFALFGVGMVTAVRWWAPLENDADGFLVADRTVPVWRAALSIAVSWIWAPAIFICSLQAYQNGLPGIFWFTAPNILCFFVFTPLAIRLRKQLPCGYTPAEFMAQRFPSSAKTHLAYLTVLFGYQLGSIIINSLAGGLLLNSLTGVDVRLAIFAMSALALSYSLASGLKASIVTDVIQMLLVLVIAGLLVPWCLLRVGLAPLSSGLGGITGAHRSLADPWIAFTMGIPMTLSLLSGPVADQMFFQRSQAVRPPDIRRTFTLGALLFGVVPVLLSALGFVGAELAREGQIVVGDPQLVGVTVVSALLPKIAVYAFTIMALAGLCSTLDSSFCAISALGSVDIYKRYLNPNASSSQMVRAARWIMLSFVALGTGIALLEPKLMWMFLILGTLAAAGFFPMVFAITSNWLTGSTAFLAIALSLSVGLPISVYANMKQDPYLIVAASTGSFLIGLALCGVDFFRRRSAPLAPQSEWPYSTK